MSSLYRHPEHPHWLHAWASDSAPGDVLKLDGVDGPAVHLDDRDYPDVTETAFHVLLGDGTRTTLRKSAAVWIHDPDGEVERRIRAHLDAAL